MRKKALSVLALAGLVCGVGICVAARPAPIPQQAAASGQPSQAGIDQDIQLLRQDLRSKKKQMVAANLSLTDAEATKFWPVYDQYIVELTKIHDEKYAVLKEFVEGWGKLTDDQAMSLTNRALTVDRNVTGLRLKYVPIFSKVLPGTKVATFFQIDRRLQALVDLQLQAQLPLVQAQ